MALIKAELIVFGTGQTVLKDGRRITIEPATLAWRINEFEGEALLVDAKFSEVLGVSTTEMPWIIAKHNTVRKSSKPTSSVTDESWAGKDYLDYELPRWSWLRGYAHEEKFMDIHPTISGDVVFVGRVPSREMLVIMARMPAGSNAFIIGRQHTMDQWADGTQQRIDATISGVKIITIFEKVGNWLLALQDCPEFELRRVACVAFGLTKYTPSIVGSVSEFATIAKTGTSLLAVGPAEGSTTNDDEQRQIYSVPFSAGAISSRDVDWPTRSLYNTKVVIGKKRPMFKRKAVKPHSVPLSPPVGFYGMQLNEIVEEDYSDYTAQRDASTDAEWKLAMDKFATREVFSWGKGEVTIDGKVLKPLGPNWVSRHETNWRFAYKQAGLDQRPTPINVLVIGVFEGLSVNMWNQIMGSQRGKIYTVDVGRTLEGAWGLPRCCTIEGNLPSNTVPFIGQSGVVLPLLTARLGQMDLQVDIVEIDGSHHCDDVYLDCEYAWRLLAQGGIMVLDDYGFENTSKYQPADGNYIFNATRGVHAFLWQHASEYELIDVPDNFYQLILRKKVRSHHMLGTASIPYDMDGVWDECRKDGTFKRHVNFYRPGIPGLIGEHGSDRLWYAPAQSGQIALDALTLPLKSVASVPAAALDIGGQIATNIGGGFEQVGEAIGKDQKDNAVAGFGNMFKSFGAAAGATGSFLAWGARKTAEVWVPQEARWW